MQDLLGIFIIVKHFISLSSDANNIILLLMMHGYMVVHISDNKSVCVANGVNEYVLDRSWSSKRGVALVLWDMSMAHVVMHG